MGFNSAFKGLKEL